MSGSTDPTARAADFIRTAPRTFADLSTKINASTYPELWKSRGVWASGVLAEVLGDDWPGKFQAKAKQPYLRFALAPYTLQHVASLVEFAARLRVLDGSPGLPTVLRQMRSQLEAGVINSARLQFDVAALEKRRSNTVALEVDRGPRNWKPDVMLAHGESPIGVECLYMGVGDEVAVQLQKSAAEGAEIDGWKRIGAKLATKAGQPAQDGGWLRCELDEGMFANEPFMKSALAAAPLEHKGAQLAQGALEQMAISGDIHGVVFSGLPGNPASKEDEAHSLPDGSVALRRTLPGERIRETFIIPNAGTASPECKVWLNLYDDEPSWLQWALMQAGLPDADR
ncbi:MAG TPA: hypothetical protein VGS97_27910 [Actinocrinis sp.]|uniref:hypothetical protein n=1 Tax=Actinocrinis sp. TaxID=1920516 RepID=UPI002DDD81C3|nr:hypothetical protein [Actinocrinis sp.]HEV2347945.1 hypothetical protein [Actinocrinis sp.]